MLNSTAEAPLSTLRPSTVVDELGRLFGLFKELMRLQGARLPELQGWRLKQRVVQNLYDDMQHASHLLARRRELPGGRAEPEPLPEELSRAFAECLFAPGDGCFCASVYFSLKSLVVAACRTYLARSTSVSDLPTRAILEDIIANQNEQIAWMRGALELSDVTSAERTERRVWSKRLEEAVAAAGGISVDGPRQPELLPEARAYIPALDARREPRQMATFDFRAPQAGSADPRVVEQFTGFFKEMAATETVAVLLWEAPAALPWEFFADTARHCWDEMRHCLAGQQRLEQLGFDIWSVPVQTGAYDIRSRMPLLERYAFLTQFQERFSFDHKHANEDHFRAAGDTVSADMVAFDIADETAHVKFGLRWLPELQRELGDTRPLAKLLEESKEMYGNVETELRHERSGESYI